GLVGLLLLAVPFALRFWPARTPPATRVDDDEDEEFDRLLTVVNPGYVGIAVCAECHARRAARVKTTRHYLACTTASGVKAPGFMPGRGQCDTRVPGLRFEMSRSGNNFFITAIRDTPAGEDRTPYQVGLVYGSGNKRDEMYFAWEDERLVRLPV